MSVTSPAAESTTLWLAHLRREAERFAAVVAASPLEAHVPAYPDFTVRSLAAHIGRGLRLFHTILSGGSGENLDIEVSAGEVSAGEVPAGKEVTGEEVADWVLAGLSPLVTLLGEVPPDKPVPFPHQTGDRPAGLIAPLLAVEVGVHRWDVESVLGAHVPIPSDLAVQEVESVFANFVPRLAGSGVAEIGGSVWLRTTDTASAWSARVAGGHAEGGHAEGGHAGGGRLVTERAPDGPGDAAVVVTGTAQDIALLVWKRALPPRPELEVTGSADVLKRFLVTDYIPDPRTTPAH
jgi:uncharacterized protein (TIGR03083 family)